MARDPTISFMSCVQVLHLFLKVIFQTHISKNIDFIKRHIIRVEVSLAKVNNINLKQQWLDHSLYDFICREIES